MSSGNVNFPYLRDLELYHHEKPFILEDTTSYDKGVITNAEKEYHPVHLTDIRVHEDEYGYESHSFRFIKHATAIDFINTPKQDSLAYIKETMAILQRQFGSERTICYDVRVSVYSLACVPQSHERLRSAAVVPSHGKTSNLPRVFQKIPSRSPDSRPLRCMRFTLAGAHDPHYDYIADRCRSHD